MENHLPNLGGASLVWVGGSVTKHLMAPVDFPASYVGGVVVDWNNGSTPSTWGNYLALCWLPLASKLQIFQQGARESGIPYQNCDIILETGILTACQTGCRELGWCWEVVDAQHPAKPFVDAHYLIFWQCSCYNLCACMCYASSACSSWLMVRMPWTCKGS